MSSEEECENGHSQPDCIKEEHSEDRKNSHSSNDSDDNSKSNSAAAAAAAASAAAKRHIACSLCRKRKLKCDGQRPKCSTCAKQNHICEYTETFRKAGPRRGYVKTLEQRVSQLEQLLADARTTKNPSMPAVTAESGMIDDDDDENNPNNTFNFPIGNVGVGTAGHGVGGGVTSGMGIPVDPVEFTNQSSANHGTAAEPMNFLQSAEREEEYISKNTIPISSTNPEDGYLSNNMQLSGLNMDEPLPPDEMIEELLDLYFNGLNRMIPMIDKARFVTKMSLGFSQRPKLFLQYAVFLMAACASDKYSSLSPLFYKRACKYMHKAETSSQFKDVASVQYVQASVLLSTFEYRNALFPQAWLRVGTTMRACYMLNMHVVDVESYNDSIDEVTQSDSSLTDEIRRTFWVAVLCDRTASSGTGWPCVAKTSDIFTKIPLEDELPVGKKSHLATYESIFRNPETLAHYKGSRLMIYILYSECQYEIAKLIMFPRKEHDLSPSGPWMSQYTRIDNLLSVLIFVLEPVPPSDESPDRNLVINLHLMIHTAILCLNKCALLGIQNSPDLLRQFKREELLQRCANAATEITLLIRMSRDISSISSHPILTFVIYTCARFFLTAVQSGAAEFIRFKSHLDFLITTLRIMRIYMPMAQMFCDSIIAAAGEMFKGRPVPEYNCKLPPACLWPEPDIKPDTLRKEEEIVFGTPTSMNGSLNSNTSAPTTAPTTVPSTGSSNSPPVQSEYIPPTNGYFNQQHHQQQQYRFQATAPQSYPTTSPDNMNSSDDLNHVPLNNAPSSSSDGGRTSSSFVSSGLTPLTATPDPMSLPPQSQPQSSGFAVNLDWSSLMTTEAMWSEILGTSDSNIRNMSD